MDKLLIIAIILGLIAIYLWYNKNKQYKKLLKEKFTIDEIKRIEELNNKEDEEIKKKEKEISNNIELLEKKLDDLEDIFERDNKTLNNKYTGDKLKEQKNKLMENYNNNNKLIKDKFDLLLQELNKVRGITR
jgi:type I site-specific restriction endonuclease